MNIPIASGAVAALLLAAPVSQADGPRPIEAARLDLGPVSGVAYYTVEPDGYHVVATVGGEGGTPVRVEVVLAPGARLDLSTAGPLGGQPKRLAIQRRGDALSIEPAVAELD